MLQHVYALLVGVDNYPPELGRLRGCVNDVDQLGDFLRRDGVGLKTAEIVTLKDADATRVNVIGAFRRHLGRARAGDVALFHFSGHGARWASAAAFREAFPDGWDEGLVCIDSRAPGSFDLADKELAVLIDEVAANGAHVVISLDCCHAGSGTRSADAFRGLRPRVTHTVHDQRPLESYLDGHYSQLQAQGCPLAVPTGRHVMLAACERTQQACETSSNHGVFTETLLEVLNASGGQLSYAELFVRCRAAVRRHADAQLPQFETYGHFNAWSGFLDRPMVRAARRYAVASTDGEWHVDCGAIQGLPTQPDRDAEFTLYAEDGTVAGTASVLQVGAQRSVLRLAFAADQTSRFRAELTTLPVPPELLWISPDAPMHAALARALAADAAVCVALTEVADAANYVVMQEGALLVLSEKDNPLPIQRVAIDAAQPDSATSALLSVLAQVARWRRSVALSNPASGLDTTAIDFACEESARTGNTAPPALHAGPEVTLESVREDRGDAARWADVHARLRARNRSGRMLHFLLAYHSPDFGVQVLRNDPVPPSDAWFTLYGDGEDEYFWVAEDENETIDRFKLIVSTERVDGFLLELPDLERGATLAASTAMRTLGAARRIGQKLQGEQWLTKELVVRTVRRLDELGLSDWKSASGRITVKGHPAITASISLRQLPPPGRGAAGVDPFMPALKRAGLRSVDLGGTRGESVAVLELTNLQHAGKLREQPLELVLDVPLEAGEGILPFVFDGQHLMPCGQPFRDDQGRSHVMIDALPNIPPDRRSLGSTLKLYFFKTWLRRRDVNRLAAIDFHANGTFERDVDRVSTRVAAARRILLLVHGIIGDTDGIADGVRVCGLDARFDLVLSYDYENLATPIGETARHLGADLRAAGLGPHDGRHLTLLVHSMGGLVSRWFIEREGGNAMVDHLVMCGTPNQGSPFGRVDDARKVVTMLAGLAANAAPALLPFIAPLLFVLNRSKQVTPTLQQMDAGSDFIHGLNTSPDPGVRYTLLAGDVAAYDDASDPLFARLLAQLGRSTLFDMLFAARRNDIAVAVDSVQADLSIRPAATLIPVACHHLNYFSSPAGQAALASVTW